MDIFVGNLSKVVTEEDLKTLFSEYGNVRSVKIIRDLFSSESKGFAFIEMPAMAEAKKAIEGLNSVDLKGKRIVVNPARPRNDKRKSVGRGKQRNIGGRHRSGGRRGW